MKYSVRAYNNRSDWNNHTNIVAYATFICKDSNKTIQKAREVLRHKGYNMRDYLVTISEEHRRAYPY